MNLLRLFLFASVGCLCLIVGSVHSQESTGKKQATDSTLSKPSDEYARITLKGGRIISGTIVAETDENIRLQTESEVFYTVSKNQIASMEKSTSRFQETTALPKKAETLPSGGAGNPLADRYPSSRGSLLFDAQLVYSSLAPDKGDALSNLSLSLNGYVFVVRGVGLGVSLGSTSVSGVGIGKNTTTESVFYIGPKVLFALGTSKSSVYPYLHAAYQSYTATSTPKVGASTSVTASSARIGLGFLFRSFPNVGTPLEFAAEFRQFDNVKQTLYTISFGLSGFLFELF